MEYSKKMIKKIIKRDGRLVDFDKIKISNAIWKAAKAVGGKDKTLADELANKVVKELERIFKDKTPSVEDVQDIVEKILIEEGHARTAKAYILYRQERRLIREEKKKILQKEAIDEVDKNFDVNALRVLAARYLLKDEEGKLIEGPKQMFERVALHVALVDVLYDKRFFIKEGGIKERQAEEELKQIQELRQKLDEYDNKLAIGKYRLNKWHFDGLLMIYERLLQEGKVKVGIKQVIKSIEKGELNDYEKIIDEYYEIMAKKDFMPNSPTLMNAGTKIGQLSACFVLPIEDSLKSIMKASSEAALICQSGGGIGINYSPLRPNGDIVSSTSGVASGPVSFMDIIDTITDVVKQGGRRRGANMAILEVWHPDIEEFITIKQKLGKLENFNLSVGLWQDFYDALEADSEYALINPRTKKQVKSISTRKLFDLIAFSAWKSAEPGVLFFDNINKYNVLLNIKGPIRATNPCGEQPLYSYESCNLGSINLRNFVKETENGVEFDWQRYEKVIRLATHFLDNVVDINKYPLEEIERGTRTTRKIGLGIMGLGDLLYELEIPYNSEEGYELMNKLAEALSYFSMDESIEIAKERGKFKLYEKSDYPKGKIPVAGYYEIPEEKHNYDWNKLIEKIKQNGIRNAFTTTIAPTGSISMIAGCSNGVEPIFGLVFEKHVTVGKFYYANEIFERKLKALGLYNDEILAKIAKNYGCLLSLNEFDDKLKRVFVTAMSIHWFDHIIAQATWQRWISASISKTINMPNDVGVDDVKLAYLVAKDLGLKGLTIYRDGSRHQQVLHIPSEEKQKFFEIKPSAYALMLLKNIKSDYAKKEVKEYLKRYGKEILKFEIEKTIKNETTFEKGETIKQVKNNENNEKVLINKPVISDKSEMPINQPKQSILRNLSSEIKNPSLLDDSGRLFNGNTNGKSVCPICNGTVIFEAGCNKCIECGWSTCVVS